MRARALVLALALVALPAAAVADEAFITDQNGDDVKVLDLATRKVVATIAIGGKPAGIAMAHDGRRAYVSSTNGKYVSAIDTDARKVVAKLNLPDECVGIAIGADDRFVYAVGFFKGEIYKIDATTLTLIATAPLGAPRPASPSRRTASSSSSPSATLTSWRWSMRTRLRSRAASASGTDPTA